MFCKYDIANACRIFQFETKGVVDYCNKLLLVVVVLVLLSILFIYLFMFCVPSGPSVGILIREGRTYAGGKEWPRHGASRWRCSHSK